MKLIISERKTHKFKKFHDGGHGLKGNNRYVVAHCNSFIVKTNIHLGHGLKEEITCKNCKQMMGEVK